MIWMSPYSLILLPPSQSPHEYTHKLSSGPLGIARVRSQARLQDWELVCFAEAPSNHLSSRQR